MNDTTQGIIIVVPLSSLISPFYRSISISFAQSITFFSPSSFLWVVSLSTGYLSKSVFSLTTFYQKWRLLSILNAPLQILIFFRLMSSSPLLMPSAAIWLPDVYQYAHGFAPSQICRCTCTETYICLNLNLNSYNIRPYFPYISSKFQTRSVHDAKTTQQSKKIKNKKTREYKHNITHM